MLRAERDPWGDWFVPVKAGRHFGDHMDDEPFHEQSVGAWDEYHERLYDSNSKVWRAIGQRLKWMTVRRQASDSDIL